MNVFGVSHSALTAQTARLNVTAENLANAEVASGDPETAFKGRYPVFKSVLNQESDAVGMSVKFDGTVEDNRPARSSYEPGIPWLMKMASFICRTLTPCRRWPT